MRTHVAWLLTFLVACTNAPAVREAPSPATAPAGEPRLSVSPAGVPLLSWLESQGEVDTLKFSRWEADAWSTPQTVSAGSDWFVNWADFPSVIELADQTLVAHWLQMEGEGTYAYGVRLAFSADGGQTWSDPVFPHDDGTTTEHGFVSMIPWGASELLVMWLDGRDYAAKVSVSGDTTAATEEMQVRAARFDNRGEKQQEWQLDPRVCDCCQTALTALDGVAVALYRDRTDAEVRDISSVRFSADTWSRPAPVADQGWEIPGCPVNGPAVAVGNGELVAAWYTAAGGVGSVWVAWSGDRGASWEEPHRVDSGDPLGRVDIGWLGRGQGVVSWMETDAEGEASILVRAVARSGRAGDPFVVGSAAAARSSGFPQLEVTADGILMAWTTPEAGITTAWVTLP